MHGFQVNYLKHYLRIVQLNLRDRDNLRTKDRRPIPKVSFVRRFDCNHKRLHEFSIAEVQILDEIEGLGFTAVLQSTPQDFPSLRTNSKCINKESS